MGMGLGGLGRLGKLGIPAPSEGVGDIIRSIFADGTDGFYFDFSKTDRLFQNVTGVTPADDAGENIALALESSKWSGRTLAQQLAQQSELWTNPVPTITNFGGSVGAYDQGTRTMTNSGSASGGWPRFLFNLGLTVGRRYQVQGTLTGSIAKITLIRFATGGTANNLTYNSSTGEISGSAVAANSGLEFVLDPLANWTGGDSITISSLSIKEIPGNHGVQATTSAQPKWQTGGLARFDGSDDNLLTTLSPSATAMTMLAKFKITGASRALMGVSGASDRCFISTNASGQFSGGIGTQSFSAIAAGADIRGVVGVGALVFGSSTVKLYWNGSEIYSAASAGAPSGSVAMALGGINSTASPGNVTTFADADLYHALAIKKALTAAEIAAITNLWGTS